MKWCGRWQWQCFIDTKKMPKTGVARHQILYHLYIFCIIQEDMSALEYLLKPRDSIVMTRHPYIK